MTESDGGADSGFFARLFALFGAAGGADRDASIDESVREAARGLPEARRAMIERAVAFHEKTVHDVMAPRAAIVAVDVETPLQGLIRAFADAGHSRLPVYRGDLDEPLGMVHIKDVMQLIANPGQAGPEPVLQRIRRDVLFAPPSMRITDLLRKMQASRIHMALVIDEFGGTDGLLTIEDLVEEVVGDINDEHDEAMARVVACAGGGWEADAGAELQEFYEATGLRLDHDEADVDTIGGLVVALAGKVPQRGDVIRDSHGREFEIVEASPRRVRRVRVRRTPSPHGETFGRAAE